MKDAKQTAVVILGAGGHAQVVADSLLRSRDCGEQIEVIGFLDDDPELRGRRLLGLEVLGPLDRIDELECDAVVAIGKNPVRLDVFRRMSDRGRTFARAIHPSSTLALEVEVGPGSMICAGAVVNTGSRIGRNVILNTGCTIDHHNIIGDHVHAAPGARLGGHVTVEEGAMIGIGAVVIPGCRIGAWSVVAAGAVVIEDVPSRTRVIGVPAQPR